MIEKIFEVINSRAHQGWLMIDQNYQVVYANQSMCQWLAQEQKSFIGKSLLDALYKGKRRSSSGHFHGPLIETIAVGRELTKKECCLSVCGEHKWFLANTYLIPDQTGNVEFALGDYVIIDKYKLLEEKLDNINLSIIRSFTDAIGARDSYTKEHSECVAELMLSLAQYMQLEQYNVGRVYLSGLVHDIGKIGIPEHILNKPGRLTSEEFAIIQKHPNIGASILDNINGFEDIASAVRCHHERYDGTGYPNQISGDQIPLFSRMLAVCDTFDAMTSARCYRQPFSEQEAVMEIRRCSGSQFDPDISEAFIEMLYYRDNIGELNF